jgi:hypothetical protein
MRPAQLGDDMPVVDPPRTIGTPPYAKVPNANASARTEMADAFVRDGYAPHATLSKPAKALQMTDPMIHARAPGRHVGDQRQAPESAG